MTRAKCPGCEILKIDIKNNKKDRSGSLGWLFALPLALVVFTHGMIHLMYVTWNVEETSLGFNGESYIPSSVAGPIIMALTVLVIVSYSAAALGLIRFPVLRKHVPSLVIIGSAASLISFAIMFPGLVPDPVAHIFGPITSIALAIGSVYRKSITNGAVKVLPRFLSKRIGGVA